MSLPTVALVGRPNVGKSALFNRLTGTRRALVHDMSGVTRDRLYGRVEWEGRTLQLVDTGGLVPTDAASMEEHIGSQVEMALSEASVILFVVDGKAGLTGHDEEIAQRLRKRRDQTPVIVVVNKADSPEHVVREGEFHRLGFPDVRSTSGLHGRGADELLDRVVELLPEPTPDEATAERPLRVAFVGKPNAGKSSLVNHLVAEERLIVSPEAGTTREAIDVPFASDDPEARDMVLVDTAGLRRKGRSRHGVEGLMRLSSEKAVRMADIVVLLLDGTEPLSHQDKVIAGLVQESRKPCILVLNKIDLLEDHDPRSTAGEDPGSLDRKLEEWEDTLDHQMSWFAYAPRIALSAETGENVDALLESLVELAGRFDFRIPTPRLNRMIREATIVHPPRSKGGRALKIRYAFQRPGRPGVFVFKVNDPELLHFSFQRYLENLLRQEGDFVGVPLSLHFQKRGLGKRGEQEHAEELAALAPPKASARTRDEPAGEAEEPRRKPARTPSKEPKGGKRAVRRKPARKKGGGGIRGPAREDAKSPKGGKRGRRGRRTRR